MAEIIVSEEWVSFAENMKRIFTLVLSKEDGWGQMLEKSILFSRTEKGRDILMEISNVSEQVIEKLKYLRTC